MGPEDHLARLQRPSVYVSTNRAMGGQKGRVRQGPPCLLCFHAGERLFRFQTFTTLDPLVDALPVLLKPVLLSIERFQGAVEDHPRATEYVVCNRFSMSFSSSARG